jgi:hypothetical protein
MWTDPYLETCCRAALHRLVLAGPSGRPETATDKPCLRRLEGMGFAVRRDDGRFAPTALGQARHGQEVLRVGK